ncbi:hypothetical protein ACWDSJ_20435 [Nocardia sp. NPDC003482]
MAADEYGEVGIFFGEHMPRGWLWPAIVVLLGVLAAAIVVMVLVSNAHFDPSPTTVPTTTPGTCEPFCTGGSLAPAQPH